MVEIDAETGKTRDELVNQALFNIVVQGPGNPKMAGHSVKSAIELRKKSLGKDAPNDAEVSGASNGVTAVIIYPMDNMVHPEIESYESRFNEANHPSKPSWAADEPSLRWA